MVDFFKYKLVLIILVGIMAQGHPARKRFARRIFKLDSWSPGGRFISYWTHQLIKFEEKKRFGQFEIMKNER